MSARAHSGVSQHYHPVRPVTVTFSAERRYRGDVDEAALIASARTSPDAFGRLYDATVGEVYRFALSLTGEHAHAEDVTAETYRRALTRLDRYEDRGKPFAAWLFTIARNLVRDAARRDGRESPLLDHDSPVHVFPGEALLRGERRAAVQRALKRLPMVQRRVMVLRYGHERSCRDVAAELGKSEAAVKQLSYRAACNLRRLLEEDGYVHEID